MTVGMLALCALCALSGVGCGWALARLQLARSSAILNESIRDGHARLYASMEDGRRQDRYEVGRYPEGG